MEVEEELLEAGALEVETLEVAEVVGEVVEEELLLVEVEVPDLEEEEEPTPRVEEGVVRVRVMWYAAGVERR